MTFPGIHPKSIGLLYFPYSVILALLGFLLLIPGVIRAQDTATEAAPALQTTPAAQPRAPEPTTIPLDTTSSTYRLQPYDLIDVDVYSEEDLHKPARLGSDGTVILPLIGSVAVGGLTVAEATDLIAKRYGAGFVKNPSVLITVLQYRKATFSVLGQVLRPGIFEIPEGAHLTILDAASLAGGYLPSAAQNEVMVKRTVDGKNEVIKIRAGDMAQDANMAPFELQAGDSIIVPSRQYKKSDFSILGQVVKPGLYDIPEGANISLIDAISLAGGFTPTASQSSIAVKRMVEGKLQILNVNANDMVQNPSTAPFQILPGDIILVPFRNSTFSILGQVEKPGSYEIAEGSHVNIIEAILMAGGFTRTAAQNSVTVKRMVKGKLETIKVRAGDMAEKENLVPFEVLPGDIIKVNESWY
jgi:polysaccharide export outer membrane protein